MEALPESSPAPSHAAPGPEINVRLDCITKSYGAKLAVRNVSLDLRAGEVFAFLGPNGAGKTTTMRITTGLLRPDSGTATVCGHPVTADALRAKELMAYLPDQPFLYDKLTGREFIHFVRDMYNVDSAAAEARLAELSRRLDMAAFLDRMCEYYSHGMKQKVALTAALVHAPRVLVVDEPMVGLDPRTVHVTKSIFREIARSGGTVFMSTHTLDVAESIADRIGIIVDGRVIALGTLDELRAMVRRSSRLEEIFLRLTGDAAGQHEGGD